MTEDPKAAVHDADMLLAAFAVGLLCGFVLCVAIVVRVVNEKRREARRD